MNGATLAAAMRVIVIGNREIEDGADVLEEPAAIAPVPAAEPAASETPAQAATASSTKG